MRVSSNRRPRGGRSNPGNGRPNSSGGRHGSNNNNNNRRSSGGNRSYDSNGPDGKIRGSASQVYDKYTSLARDSQTSGDPVAAENFFQHAEHYFRIMLANNLVKAERTAEQASAEDAASDNGENKQGTVEVAEQSVDASEAESDVKDLSLEEQPDIEAAVEEPGIVDLSEAQAPQVDSIASEDGNDQDDKPKSKRRVSRTRGLRRRTSRRSDEAEEADEPQTTE